MTFLIVFCSLGLVSGFLLMVRVPKCAPAGTGQHTGDISHQDLCIIVPARNEEHNLPQLFDSLIGTGFTGQLLVVDDHSTDRTSEIAEQYGARVVRPDYPPPNVSGKAWACQFGAENTKARNFLFLDADTFFEADGLVRVIQMSALSGDDVAFSILPFAVTKEWYEELSIFFNLLMAFGAGGFGAFQRPRLFGQSLHISRRLYEAAGGHRSVAQYVLENFELSNSIYLSGGRCACFGGIGTLKMRMFPDGFSQLYRGWTKAFAQGAQSSDPQVLVLSVYWLSALVTIGSVWPLLADGKPVVALAFYAIAVAQIFVFRKSIGSFRFITCLLFPVPLLFFFTVFARSWFNRVTRKTTNWRGREV